jgi:hypothetical protein
MNRAELISEVAKLLRTSAFGAEMLIKTAPNKYRHYTIDKRSGGTRDIYHPAPALKSVQRWLVSQVFQNIPVHDSVYSYVKGRNIREHASQHVRGNFFLRLDFVDFFPSIDDQWVSEFLLRRAGEGYVDLSPNAIPAVARLVCRKGVAPRPPSLSIGAPSSPAISNAILFDLDSILHQMCVNVNVKYTRYADDIYCSTRMPNVLRDVELNLRRVCADICPKLRINEQKTQRLSRKRRVLVTGLVVTSSRGISLGRRTKRRIRTQIYLWSENQLHGEQLAHLRGLLCYAQDVERSFVENLQAKFGVEVIDRLIHG